MARRPMTYLDIQEEIKWIKEKVKVGEWADRTPYAVYGMCDPDGN